VTTPPSVESDLGWALGAVMRSYLQITGELLGDIPGGPRGYQVLAASGRGEPRSQLALAQQLGVDRTVMTYLLDDLEGAGLVERRSDPADRRARRVGLTDAGNAQLCELDRRLHEAEEQLLEPLDVPERDMLRELLQRLATRSGAAADSPCAVADEMAAVEIVQPAPRSARRRARR
jgi:DNA-binding MarR family transcriptional regulator